MTKLEGYKQFDGLHWETGSVRNFMDYRGYTAPHTGQPFSEAMLMGISGGAVIGRIPSIVCIVQECLRRDRLLWKVGGAPLQTKNGRVRGRVPGVKAERMATGLKPDGRG